MREFIVDASVILKWVIGSDRECDQDKARLLLRSWVDGKAEISAPVLWKFEVGNFLGREFPEGAKEKMDLLLNLNIRSVELSTKMCLQCFGWMKQHQVTFYDASYLAAAYEIQGDLITSDEKFSRKMKEIDCICLLKDLTL